MENDTGYDYNQEGSLITAEALERSKKRRESVQGIIRLKSHHTPVANLCLVHRLFFQLRVIDLLRRNYGQAPKFLPVT